MYKKNQYTNNKVRRIKTLPCEGYTTHTDWGNEFDCGYDTDISCEDCVLNGGDFDPRYNQHNQPKKLSKFILHTKQVNAERIQNELKGKKIEVQEIKFKKL